MQSNRVLSLNLEYHHDASKEAQGIKWLIEEFCYTQEKAAKALSKPRSTDIYLHASSILRQKQMN